MKVLVAQLCLTLGTPWTIACRASLSMEWVTIPFSRGSSLPCETPGKPICFFSILYAYFLHHLENPLNFHLILYPAISQLIKKKLFLYQLILKGKKNRKIMVFKIEQQSVMVDRI